MRAAKFEKLNDKKTPEKKPDNSQFELEFAENAPVPPLKTDKVKADKVIVDIIDGIDPAEAERVKQLDPDQVLVRISRYGEPITLRQLQESDPDWDLARLDWSGRETRRAERKRAAKEAVIKKTEEEEKIRQRLKDEDEEYEENKRDLYGPYRPRP